MVSLTARPNPDYIWGLIWGLGVLVAGKLSTRKVQTAKAGKHSDGGNLYLIVSHTGSRKWVLRFTWRGNAKEMGLGSAIAVPLADAREKAAAARRRVAQGLSLLPLLRPRPFRYGHEAERRFRLSLSRSASKQPACIAARCSRGGLAHVKNRFALQMMSNNVVQAFGQLSAVEPDDDEGTWSNDAGRPTKCRGLRRCDPGLGSCNAEPHSTVGLSRMPMARSRGRRPRIPSFGEKLNNHEVPSFLT
jgi:Arm DNA-binding domain